MCDATSIVLIHVKVFIKPMGLDNMMKQSVYTWWFILRQVQQESSNDVVDCPLHFYVSMKDVITSRHLYRTRSWNAVFCRLSTGKCDERRIVGDTLYKNRLTVQPLK